MKTIITSEAEEYLSRRSAHWDALAERFSHDGLRSYYHRRITTIYKEIVPEGATVLEIGCARGDLLAALSPSAGIGVDFSKRMIMLAKERHPDLEFIQVDAHDLDEVTGCFDYIIFSDLIDDLWDVQGFLEGVRKQCSSSTRIVFNVYSHFWSLPLQIAQMTGFANQLLPQNWLDLDDVKGLLQLTGFELMSTREEILIPFYLPVLTSFCNRYLAKFKPFSWLTLTNVMVAAPVPLHEYSSELPLVSVIVPCRNEAGNIREIVARVPNMGRGVELIFVEGGSVDGTGEEIRRVLDENPALNGQLYTQTGRGKGDAVRLGFEKASGEILMILDADLTVAPEELPKFYNALVGSRGEFINGVRLVYPMAGEAMRFANLLGNKFFSFAFSWLLGQKIKDTLCGTKALWKTDYLKIASNRKYLGDFDPFGDFDLLFGAARLNLKIVDLPVRYGERTYGSTNINRWAHGWLLLRMVIFAARRLKFV